MSRDGSVLAHLRHELRTPLNHVSGYAELLLEDVAVRRPELAAGLQAVHARAHEVLSMSTDALAAPRAVRMAVEMRARFSDLAAGWRRRGWDLGLSIGIAQGYATLGAIGFEGRLDSAAMGRVMGEVAVPRLARPMETFRVRGLEG